MNVNDVKKVSVFDFDGTLIDTTMPDVGKEIWKKATGEEYPHKGWWGRRESLNIDIFENKPFDDIVSEFRKEVANPNTFVSLCTGRIIPLTNEVQAILDKYGFRFDEIALTGDKRWNEGANNTLKFKINYLDDLKNRFPNMQEIEFWDDRNEHNPTFVQWGKLQEIPVKINHVHQSNR
jgi:hypothetical protein